MDGEVQRGPEPSRSSGGSGIGTSTVTQLLSSAGSSAGGPTAPVTKSLLLQVTQPSKKEQKQAGYSRRHHLQRFRISKMPAKQTTTKSPTCSRLRISVRARPMSLEGQRPPLLRSSRLHCLGFILPVPSYSNTRKTVCKKQRC